MSGKAPEAYQIRHALNNFCDHSHILMPSSSMYYGRISSPRLKIPLLGLEIYVAKMEDCFIRLTIYVDGT